MTCQECELKLGLNQDASEHLAWCAECRLLAEELHLNADALRDMRVRPGMPWALAAAAVLLLIFLRVPEVKQFPMPPVRIAVAEKAPVAVPRRKVRKRIHHAPEPLRVKMFTSDPDVVIYWIVDKKEGYE
jgi:hypothetical protein